MKYLNDKIFLRKLDLENKKRQYVRIIVLDFTTENPIASLEGISTGGTANLNGNSALRRTASCSMVLDSMHGVYDQRYKNYNKNYANITEVQNLISMNKKVKIETGFDNTLAFLGDGYYPEYDKIWFPLGTFVIKTANCSKGNNGINISLTLNDKTALLNGDMGGTIPAATVFSESELYNQDASSRTVEKVLLKDIIKLLVVDFGGENINNIIITDIPDTIVKVMKWTGNNSLFLYQEGSKESKGSWQYSEVKPTENYIEDSLKEFLYGEDVGYMIEPFVYPGTLECAAGETVASLLNKIKNALGGNYEWFYDINGRFIFQEKKNYLNTSLSSSLNITEQDYLSILNLSKSVYVFDNENRKLLTNISINPQYQNIKNDFVVWGVTKTATGADKPIRYHLVFDKKPSLQNEPRFCIVYKDYRQLQQVIVLNENNSTTDAFDIETAKKDIYYLNGNVIRHWDEETKTFRTFSDWELCYLKTDDWRTELYFQGLEMSTKTFNENYYAAELNAEWPKIYNVKKSKVEEKNGYPVYKGGYREELKQSNYEYFLDFLEGTEGGDSNISQFSVKNIGRRVKVGKDTTANCIFPTEVPPYVIVQADGDTKEEYLNQKDNNREYVQVSPSIFNKLTLGGNRTSAYDKVKEMLYQYTGYNETISLTTVPIYYLEPNTRITVQDTEIGLNGDYLINSISLPFGIGTSTISCIKCLDKTI